MSPLWKIKPRDTKHSHSTDYEPRETKKKRKNQNKAAAVSRAPPPLFSLIFQMTDRRLDSGLPPPGAGWSVFFLSCSYTRVLSSTGFGGCLCRGGSLSRPTQTPLCVLCVPVVHPLSPCLSVRDTGAGGGVVNSKKKRMEGRSSATLPSPRNPSEKRSSTPGPGALRPPSLRLQNPRSAVNQVRKIERAGLSTGDLL